MARRRKSNPEAEDLTGAVADFVSGSAAAVDLAFEEQKDLNQDILTIEQIEKRLSDEDPPRRLPREVHARLRENRTRVKVLDGLIARYTSSMVQRMDKRLDRLDASPMSALRRDEIRSIRREVFKIGKLARRKGIDPRRAISRAMGGILTIEQDITIYAPEPKRKSSRAERVKAEMGSLLAGAKRRWDQIRKHAVKHKVFFIRGAEVYHKDYGSGKVIENDGRRLLVAFEDQNRKLTHDQVTPSDVAWIDRQLSAIKLKVGRGQAVSKLDVQRVIKRMVDVHNRTKQRAPLRTYSESKRALTSMVGKIQTRLTGDKMDKDTVESFLHELEEFQVRIPSAARSEWSKVDQRQWASDVNAVRKSLIKLRRKANPCVGFHFHGKDADELLKAIEKSNSRQGKGLKKNPGLKWERASKRDRSRKESDFAPTVYEPTHDDNVVGLAEWSHSSEAKLRTPQARLRYIANAVRTGEVASTPAQFRKAKAIALKENLEANPKKKAASTRKRKGYTIRVDQSSEGLFAFAATHPEFQTFDSDYEFSTAAKAFGYVNRQIDKQEARKATSKMWGDIGMNPSKRKRNPSRQAGGFYIVDTRVGKVVAGPYSVREADMTLEESAGYDHATHQVMDERYLADLAFKAKRNPGKKKVAKKKVAKKKVAKKKVAKKTPEWQLLCNRCAKLWDHYCERPSKTRLKPVLEHLEKMKASTSKKVADERKACLRVANKEARRLKMK